MFYLLQRLALLVARLTEESSLIGFFANLNEKFGIHLMLSTLFARYAFLFHTLTQYERSSFYIWHWLKKVEANSCHKIGNDMLQRMAFVIARLRKILPTCLFLPCETRNVACKLMLLWAQFSFLYTILILLTTLFTKILKTNYNLFFIFF